jgi:hypothetical protein
MASQLSSAQQNSFPAQLSKLVSQLSSAQQNFFPAQLSKLVSQLSSAQILFIKICNFADVTQQI